MFAFLSFICITAQVYGMNAPTVYGTYITGEGNVPCVQNSIKRTICEGELLRVGSSIYSATGSYSDTLATSFGCDSIVDLELSVMPIALEMIAVSICEGDTYLLESTPYTFSGVYTSKLQNATGCDSIVELTLTVIEGLDQGSYQEVELCFGETITLEVDDDLEMREWSTSETTRVIEVDSNGVYWVEQADQNGCTRTDTISIFTVDCNAFCTVYFPDAISLSSDGEYDRFQVLYEDSRTRLSDYGLQIYNKWGEMVFKTEDPNVAWYGMAGSEPAELGTYNYIVEYTCNDKQNVASGKVLLR